MGGLSRLLLPDFMMTALRTWLLDRYTPAICRYNHFQEPDERLSFQRLVHTRQVARRGFPLIHPSPERQRTLTCGQQGSNLLFDRPI